MYNFVNQAEKSNSSVRKAPNSFAPKRRWKGGWSQITPHSAVYPLPRYLFYLCQVNVTRWLLQLRWQQRFHHKFGTPAGHDHRVNSKDPTVTFTLS